MEKTKEEFVTAGGINLKVNFKTMESKLHACISQVKS
jgi:predicted flavoprotein YhiN